MIEKCRRIENGQIFWDVDHSRIRNVFLKLARGHASYELAEPQLGEPDRYFCKPLCLLNGEEQAFFKDEQGRDFAALPEVGSRAMSRLMFLDGDIYDEGWLVVQESRYKFRALQQDGVTIQMILRDYIACSVVWH